MPQISINDIVVKDRYRKEIGCLDALERSIGSIGLMQPIGLTKDLVLIFGERRLRACRNLGMNTIEARIFDLDVEDPALALRMEQSENDIRKEMTPSEKVALAMAIEEALGNRQGQRTDIESELVPSLAQVEPGQKTIEKAAEAVGLKRETYRQAKAVVNSGDEEAVERMDAGEPISRVYKETVKKNTLPTPKKITITLYENPVDDAIVLTEKAGKVYTLNLALELLKLAGHHVDIRDGDAS